MKWSGNAWCWRFACLSQWGSVLYNASMDTKTMLKNKGLILSILRQAQSFQTCLLHSLTICKPRLQQLLTIPHLSLPTPTCTFLQTSCPRLFLALSRVPASTRTNNSNCAKLKPKVASAAWSLACTSPVTNFKMCTFKQDKFRLEIISQAYCFYIFLWYYKELFAERNLSIIRSDPFFTFLSNKPKSLS